VLARSTPDTRPWLVRMLRGPRAGTRPTPLGPSGWPLTATDLMAPSLITVRPEESLTHAIRLMMQYRVKRLIVVDSDGRFRGLVDRREILRLLAGESKSGPG
jgi:CBS domain-containing protein